MALTEHYSTSNAYEAWTMDLAEWADLKKAADYFTSDNFAAMPAYEYYLVANTGEINTFGISDLPPKQEFLGPDRLPLYQEWIAQQGGVGQFNHPTYVTHDFKDYAGWTAARDAAMRAQRGYATMDKNLSIRFSVNGGVMGSTLSGTASAYTADVKIWDPDALAGRAADAVTLVEIVSDGGKVVRSYKPSTAAGTKAIAWTEKELPVTARYFWVRVSTASDDVNMRPGVTAWTAPVWTGRQP